MDERNVGLTELARITGKSRNSLLRAEERGWIPRAHRDSMGWRYWTQDQVTDVIRMYSRG